MKVKELIVDLKKMNPEEQVIAIIYSKNDFTVGKDSSFWKDETLVRWVERKLNHEEITESIELLADFACTGWEYDRRDETEDEKKIKEIANLF